MLTGKSKIRRTASAPSSHSLSNIYLCRYDDIGFTMPVNAAMPCESPPQYQPIYFYGEMVNRPLSIYYAADLMQETTLS